MGWNYGISLWVFNFISHTFTALTRIYARHVWISLYVINFLLSRLSLEITWVKNTNHTSCIFLRILLFTNFNKDESSQNSRNSIGNRTGQLQWGTLCFKGDVIPSCKSMRKGHSGCICIKASWMILIVLANSHSWSCLEKLPADVH